MKYVKMLLSDVTKMEGMGKGSGRLSQVKKVGAQGAAEMPPSFAK